MLPANMCVLVLNNNFFGSYQSNQVYFTELVNAMGHVVKKVYAINNILDAQRIIESHHIDFSISFGKYAYNIDGVPLYDKYNLLHYQWVSDNPLKMNIDHHSTNIRYIFIDEEFYDIAKPLKSTPLIIPLGYPKFEDECSAAEKIDAVLIPAKIRNINELCNIIDENLERKLLWKFIESYQINTSFINAFIDFAQHHNLTSPEYFFRIINEYFRVKKRLSIVNAITSKPVHILGRDYGNNFSNRQNIIYLEPLGFMQAIKMMSAYRYVVNIDPNYYCSIHDRFIRTVACDSVGLTNVNGIWDSKLKFLYDFSSPHVINEVLLNIDKHYDEILFQEKQIVRYFSWENAIAQIIYNFIFGKEVNCYEILCKI